MHWALLPRFSKAVEKETLGKGNSKILNDGEHITVGQRQKRRPKIKMDRVVIESQPEAED